ncbi:hypothetical protein BU17DRAFT_95422 [Hysterangium stoloniferum]|nr:hypothetical protein BU17DRAFT_95422 [Hysterangium stoloniferum]
MLDGSRLRQSWASALSNAEAQFRSLLVSSSSSVWKRVPLLASNSKGALGQTAISNSKGKSRMLSTDGIVMHRCQTKRGDIMRVVLDVPLEAGLVDLDKWRAVLATPDIRVDWDPAVESSSLVEMFDWNTRITRTNYALGWPANPRDAVTISKTFHDATTLIDLSTSLPRSLDEPAYLRPAPPYVRSHVHLFAWCIQIQPAKQGDNEAGFSSPNNKLRITCFWQHDLNKVWALSSSLSQQLPTMVQGLLRTVQKRGNRLPLLCAYGTGVTIERITFEVGREALNVEYAVVSDDEDETGSHAVKALEEVNEAKERKRLERTVECVLPDTVGWDVQITTRASSEAIASLPWKATANRSLVSSESGKTVFRVRHSSLPDHHSILKVKMVIELSGSPSGLRLNGLSHLISDMEPRDPTSFTLSRQMLQDTTTVSGLSFHSSSTNGSGEASAASSIAQRGLSMHGRANRSSAAEKMILTRVKRNYIYFSSLLQEPEAKWKRSSEARGVTISQLDSIDPTLVVYRAEAVFVGVGLWDLYSAIASPGARVYWEKTHEDAVLLEDVNELTELWHWRTKANWPANPRDAVLLKTVYKSPTTAHIFSFSTDDVQLFSCIPSVDPNVIRTQVDLQGWAIETLSPTTTLLTLLEQSDPRGWAGKSSIPQQMVSAVAGVGEFAIKCGGPPINTRLAGARSLSARYDHEKGSFKLEYEGCESRRSSFEPSDTNNGPSNDITESVSPTLDISTPTLPFIECEVRCDLDTWGSSIEVVIDPPPRSVSCLRRHRLSSRGGGLWLTIGHDALSIGEDRLLVIVRKGTSKEKGAVVINGVKVKIDVEDLPETEVKALTKMKRVKPIRIPLDQPPVLGVIRRRREEWNDENDSGNGTETRTSSVVRWATSTPHFSSPLAKFWTQAIEQTAATTTAAVNAASASFGAAGTSIDAPLLSSRPPMAYALSSLAFLRNLHDEKSNDNWTLVSERDLPVHRKVFAEVSTVIPVHKGEKVIEGVSAEEVARVVNSYDCRAAWDDRFDSATVLEEFGAGCHTAFVTCKGGFPFRDRGFYLANATAWLLKPSESPASEDQRVADSSLHPNSTTILCASASFSPSSVESFDSTKYNPHGLPIGRVMVQGWILETLDPYTTENYAIPSTRCTYVVSIDFAGSVPVAFNSMLNASLPRAILTIEQYMKGNPALPMMRLPSSVVALVAEDGSRGVGERSSATAAWKYVRTDETRTLVSERYHTANKKLRAIFLISPNTHTEDSASSRPSLTATLLQDSSPLPDGPSTPQSSPTVSPASTIRSRRVSTTTSPLKQSRSISRDRISAIAASLAAGSRDPNQRDFLAGEIIVDSKLYPDGYEVHVVSSFRDSTLGSDPLSTSMISSNTTDLPLSCTCHIMPSTPLHSSGISVDAPPRHLLRLTLPTALYGDIIDQPLSLETPKKPSWLTAFETHGAILDVTLFPITDTGKGKGVVMFDGEIIDVMGEKDSIRLLRRGLEDTRLAKMPILSSGHLLAESEEIPKLLINPIAVATTLWVDSAIIQQSAKADVTSPDGGGEAKDNSSRDDTSDVTVRTYDTSQGHHLTYHQDSLRASCENAEIVVPSTGFFRFLNGYPNTLFRRSNPELSMTSRPFSTQGTSSPSYIDSNAPSLVLTGDRGTTCLFPLSTVLIIALISFLFGSLLRSLLTPADFVYIPQGLTQPEKGRELEGWREIKRLVEFKHVAGGWDFLIGIVRRH